MCARAVLEGLMCQYSNELYIPRTLSTQIVSKSTPKTFVSAAAAALRNNDDDECDEKLHVRKDMIVVPSVSRSRFFCWDNNEMVLWEPKMMKKQPPEDAPVELECRKWTHVGVNLKCETRNKASELHEGLQKEHVHQCKFVVIFDANFPELGSVQARWRFVNADECLMTRLHEMSLDYYFSIKEEVGSSTYIFFGFNVTAGVWGLRTVYDAGGGKMEQQRLANVGLREMIQELEEEAKTSRASKIDINVDEEPPEDVFEAELKTSRHGKLESG